MLALANVVSYSGLDRLQIVSDLGLGRRLRESTTNGLRVLSPPAFRPKSTRKLEVILVLPEYTVRPGMGKRSLVRFLGTEPL